MSGTLERRIYFETAETSLTPESQRILSEINDSIQTFQSYDIRIEGNTDVVADATNQAIVAKRIEAVHNYLVKNNISSTAFTNGKALSAKSTTDKSTKLGQGSNHYIDVQVQYVRISSTIIAELFGKLESPLQIYQITARQDTILIGDKGTIIQVPANAFDVAAGTTVTLRVRESMTTSDFLLDNLSTQSENKMLYSGGMLYLDAKANGKSIGLKNDLTITIPTNKTLSQMEYFTGDRNAHNKQVNWKTASGITALTLPRLLEPINERYKFERLLEEIKADSLCYPLTESYQDTPKPRRIDPPIRYVESPNFWERLRLFFGGKPKEQPKKEEVRYVARKPETHYKPVAGLSSNCREMAIFAINNSLSTASWQDIHSRYRINLYGKAHAVTYAGVIAYLKDEIKAQQKIYENKMIAFERQKLIRKQSIERAIQNRILAGTATVEDMNAYVFQTRNLGWINCDAFYNVPQERMIAMPTDVLPEENVDIKLVFRSKKSILPPTIIDGKLGFRNIPKDEDAVLVAFKMEHGQTYLAMQDIKTSASIQNLTFQPTTVEKLREKVKTLDSL